MSTRSCLATGALQPRELEIPGRELGGIHQAMDYLPLANRVRIGELAATPIDAAGKQVVIIGGGEHRRRLPRHCQPAGCDQRHPARPQPAAPRGPRTSTANPWPQWPKIHRTSAAHEEGVVESWARRRWRSSGRQDHVTAVVVEEVQIVRVDGRRASGRSPESRTEIPCDLLLIAAGFLGTERGSLLERLGVEVDPERGSMRVDGAWETTGDGVYSCGDATRGASLVVWAIAEGRACAAAVDTALSGETELPAPVRPVPGRSDALRPTG